MKQLRALILSFLVVTSAACVTASSEPRAIPAGLEIEEEGTLSNGCSYALWMGRAAEEDHYLLQVIAPDGGERRLHAHRVSVVPQANGTTAVHFLVDDLPWESTMDEWMTFIHSPGLYLHSQGATWPRNGA